MFDDDVLRATLACFDAKDKSFNVNMILFELPYFLRIFPRHNSSSRIFYQHTDESVRRINSACSKSLNDQ